MIYTVECSYTDSSSEAEWNRFYSEDKLPALISVRGFVTSQRFKAVGHRGPTYLAIHTITEADVLSQAEYRLKGGGNFARWQTHISDWHRNLYCGVDRAPAVGQAECLVLSHRGPDSLLFIGLTPNEMHAVGLEQDPKRLWLARLSLQGRPPVDHLPGDLWCYAPITAQLVSDPLQSAGQ